MKKTIAILLFLTTLVIMLLPNVTNAAAEDAVVQISADSTLVEVGDTVKITVTQYQKGTTELKKSKYVKFKLSYNKEIFGYESITEGFNATDAASNGNIEVKTAQAHQTEDISSVTLTFKALKSTTRREGTFSVSEFKLGDEDSSAEQTNYYSAKQISITVKDRYEGNISIQANKTSVPVERKVNISLAQTIPTNYVEATISYDNTHFEFVAPANSEYEADTSTNGQVTIKASGTELTDVTLLFKAIAVTEENRPSAFEILSYKAGNNSEEALNAHLYYSKQVSVAVTPRNNSIVDIRTDLTDNIAKLGDTFVVTVSQDKPTDYLQFDLFYDQEIFKYVGLGENNAEISATELDGMLTISATGSQMSEINIKFEALKLTEGRNDTNKEYITVSNFLSGDNSGDTDIAEYNIQQVGIEVVDVPVEEQPKEPEIPIEEPIEELPDTGSVLTTLIAIIVAEISIIAIVLGIYIKNKRS